VANDTPVPLNRIERILRNMIASAAGLSILAILAVILANLTGVNTRESVWLMVAVLPFIGLTLALVLIIVFMIVSVVRRRRLARDSS
jgi:ABC-type transport system involved in multi-copper enzyme maturation permease subunit